jgi:hypothetical protein
MPVLRGVGPWLALAYAGSAFMKRERDIVATVADGDRTRRPRR